MRNKVFVFDLDDTLYKEIDFLRSAYREIADWVEVEFSQTDIYPFMIKAYESKMDVFSLMIEEIRFTANDDGSVKDVQNA